jgi:oligo-1,6-glucosidase
MTNVQFTSIADYRDVDTMNMYHIEKARGIKSEQEILSAVYNKGRDNARTPMQWDDSTNAGFNESGTTWIGVNPNYKTVNVKAALANPDSILYYYKKLIALRKQEATMVLGKYELLLEDHPYLFVYTRTHKNETLLVILNMSEKEVTFEMPKAFEGKQATLVIANVALEPTCHLSTGLLGAYEARVYKILGD